MSSTSEYLQEIKSEVVITQKTAQQASFGILEKTKRRFSRLFSSIEALDRSLEKEVASILLEAGAVTFNFKNGYDFVSGIKSPMYMTRSVQFESKMRKALTNALALKYALHPELRADVIAGTATGGMGPATYLANEEEVHYVYVRADEKGYGQKKAVECGDVSDKSVLVVEDNVTTGGSAIQAIARVQEAGGRVGACLSVFSYGFKESQKRFEESGVQLHSLTTFKAVLSVALEQGLISEGEYEEAQAWHQRVNNTGE